ncbi:MAG: DUF58 domain-containing protein [Candidatus Sericytochromatia bacterium]|nr:DUF58 domain-containing protein [Candidatus Sericytochromatia bacterium]
MRPDLSEGLALARRLRGMHVRTSRLVRSRFGGAWHSVFKGQGMTFDEVREYQEGDDPRSIDWNVTARMDRLFVKRFVEERERAVILVVDVSASLDFGTTAAGTKRDLAARFAMAVALSASASHDRVGLLLFASGVEAWVPPRRGREHALRLVRTLLACKPATRGTDLGVALGDLGHVLRRPATVFLVSDFLRLDLEAVRNLGLRHDLVAVTLTDPAEERLPLSGPVLVRDPETGEEAVLDPRDERVRRRHEQAAQKRRAKLDQVFARFRIDEIALHTDEPIIRPLMRFFGRRAGRRIRRRGA